MRWAGLIIMGLFILYLGVRLSGFAWYKSKTQIKKLEEKENINE